MSEENTTQQKKSKREYTPEQNALLEVFMNLSFVDLATLADELAKQSSDVLTRRHLVGIALGRKSRKARP